MTSEETRYRKSFLLGICEGPANICKAWKGKKEILIAEFTIFTGATNVGIAALTGVDFSNYPNLCCAFFDEYELGHTEQIPNFNFEVSNAMSSWSTTIVAYNNKVKTLDYDYSVSDTINLPHTGAFTTAIDGAGNHVYGQSIVGNPTHEAVVRFSKNNVQDVGFYTPTAGNWGAQPDTVVGLRFSHDSRYLYALLKMQVGLHRLYKFDNQTGTEEWMTETQQSSIAYSLAVDSDDNAYVPACAYGGVDYRTEKYDEDGNFVITYASGRLWFDTKVVENVIAAESKLYNCGIHLGPPIYQISWRRLQDDATGGTYQTSKHSHQQLFWCLHNKYVQHRLNRLYMPCQ